MKYTDTVLLVFAKAPIKGEVNTRLIPDIGIDAATDLQAELIQSRLKDCVAGDLCDIQLWCSPDSKNDFFINCGNQFDIKLCEQVGDNLGVRMSNAINASLENYKHVVLIGTDAPALALNQIEEAIESLRNNEDVVIVPAEDGGYVLIGMSKHYKELFLSVPWGTDRVLRKTRGNAIALGLKLKELTTCWDIDRVEDYERYQRLKHTSLI